MAKAPSESVAVTASERFRLLGRYLWDDRGNSGGRHGQPRNTLAFNHDPKTTQAVAQLLRGGALPSRPGYLHGCAWRRCPRRARPRAHRRSRCRTEAGPTPRRTTTRPAKGTKDSAVSDGRLKVYVLSLVSGPTAPRSCLEYSQPSSRSRTRSAAALCARHGSPRQRSWSRG